MSGRPDAARPEWASGAEWEGWTLDDSGGSVMRNCEENEFWIYDDGSLNLLNSNADLSSLYLPSPADALDVANLIAEKLGGWGRVIIAFDFDGTLKRVPGDSDPKECAFWLGIMDRFTQEGW